MRILFYSVAMGAALAAVPALAAPGDVNAEEFYIDAKALMGKGMGAMFDKRTRPMMAQMKDAAAATKAANDAATARGEPLYCVPAAARKKGMGAEEVVAKLGRLPQSQRKASTLRQAWRAALIREFPCG
ncbi:hypothetical protein GRI40_07725 [Altererythrobacter aerius]|uniref:Rap1a immunity protein domain-containing protein n=1 Tax=Tsuneonella aeria TaxID=1837929 RepID=A0A6I4TCZ4_9SPHN|nr:hypothetical protein [Tsuneonella aeria]MXO75102.1 hypothetical protein [Tsuneonella aeria]